MNPPTRFLITGLPRSGTSWLANALTWQRCLCHHDLLVNPDWRKVLDAEAASGEWDHLGIADSGAGLFDADWSGYKIVVVDRPHDECVKSFVAYFTRHPYVGQKPPNPNAVDLTLRSIRTGVERLWNRCPEGACLRVAYDSLSEPSALKAIQHFVAPEMPFSQARWELLRAIRINPFSERINLLWA